MKPAASLIAVILCTVAAVAACSPAADDWPTHIMNF